MFIKQVIDFSLQLSHICFRYEIFWMTTSSYSQVNVYTSELKQSIVTFTC